jgi:shikimate dehydrogenase
VRLAVLGDPLAYTLSPALHRAGLEALGLEGTSEALRVPPGRLGAALGELSAAGYRGVNLTHPHKEAALAHLSQASEESRRARSVNTVVFDASGARGETTDGPGFLDLLRELGRDPARERAMLLGAGGAARAIALALVEAGADEVRVRARDPERAATAWASVPRARILPWDGGRGRSRTAEATLVINATPVHDAPGPCPAGTLPAGALVVDLTYGEEVGTWVKECRARGLPALDGLGLLVHQARRALSIWTGRAVPLEPLARAVGWPR